MTGARRRHTAERGEESAHAARLITYRPGVSTGSRSPWRRPGSAGDLLVVGYTAAAQLEVHTAVPSAGLLPRVLFAAATLVLLARRRFPLAAPVACAAGGAAGGALLPAGHGTGVDLVTLLTAAALLASQGRRGLVVLGVLAAVLAPLVVSSGQPSDLLVVPTAIAVAALAGWELSGTRRQVAALRREVEAMERAGAEEERRLLSDERRRVARELHDVVSHALTVVVLQAGAARMQLPINRRHALAALDAAAESARSALTELRRLVELIGGPVEAGLKPQPGMADLPQLLAQVAAAGLTVETNISALPPLPAGPNVVLYRVVQECLTNALRHGGGHARVRVDGTEREVCVEVVNQVPALRGAANGTGGAGSRGNGAGGIPGHGLVGMRERVALYDGTVHAGRDGDTWTVRATIPLPAEEAR